MVLQPSSESLNYAQLTDGDQSRVGSAFQATGPAMKQLKISSYLCVRVSLGSFLCAIYNYIWWRSVREDGRGQTDSRRLWDDREEVLRYVTACRTDGVQETDDDVDIDDGACRNLCSKKTDEEDEDEDTHESKLEIHFFSFTTFYYLVSACVTGILCNFVV